MGVVAVLVKAIMQSRVNQNDQMLEKGNWININPWSQISIEYDTYIYQQYRINPYGINPIYNIDRY